MFLHAEKVSRHSRGGGWGGGFPQLGQEAARVLGSSEGGPQQVHHDHAGAHLLQPLSQPHEVRQLGRGSLVASKVLASYCWILGYQTFSPPEIACSSCISMFMHVAQNWRRGRRSRRGMGVAPVQPPKTPLPLLKGRGKTRAPRQRRGRERMRVKKEGLSLSSGSEQTEILSSMKQGIVISSIVLLKLTEKCKPFI